MPHRFNRLIEPFAGMAAITIAVASERRADRYYINDINESIVRLLQTAIDTPSKLVEKYTNVWTAQFEYPDGHIEHFYNIRDRFNAGDQTPENMLYLLARCVKGSVRYGKNGNFNQSPDKRRHGTNPKNIAESVYAISAILKGQTTFSFVDYRQIFELAEPGDLVYMDPPYQGVSNTRDNRYFAGVNFEDFSDSIKTLNRKGIDFIISYDGECGNREYGNDLPQSLNCTKILLNAGLSTQSTLLGKRDTTFEALYVSESLKKIINSTPKQMTMLDILECVG
jgi:DNA adenine methylase